MKKLTNNLHWYDLVYKHTRLQQKNMSLRMIGCQGLLITVKKCIEISNLK